MMPYHIVRTDLPCALGAGRFYDAGMAASTLDFLRAHCEGQWVLLTDSGVLDDTTIPRKPINQDNPELRRLLATKPTFTLLKKAA